ncbi:MAG: FtsX-like permease family protein, partial [Terriglobales bacterium]
VNLANLLLARASGRRREMAVRGALGASPARLLRLALGETVVLALAGGGIGLLLAHFALRALLHWAPPGLPRLANVRLDGAVLWFTLGISVLAGVLAGAWPAWRMARSDPQEALRAGGGARAGESPGGRRGRELLAGIETALTAALLVTAGLLLASFNRLVNVPKGFNTQHLLTVRLQLPSAEYGQSAQRSGFWRRVLAATRGLPGVTAAAVISDPPLSGNTDVNPVTVPGDTRPIIQQPLANTRRISPGYLAMMGIPLLSGRELTAADRGHPVAVISASTARAAWPERNPIGQVFRHGDPNGTPIRVVGVVADTRAISLLTPPGLMVYQPHGDNFSSTLIVRMALAPAAVAPEVRRAIWGIDPNVPVPAMESMGAIVAQSVAPRRFQMMLVALFAAAALLLACLGIYGVVSYSVARRTQEMGVRVALGARPVDLYRMLFWQGLLPVVLGLGAGLLGALALGRALASLLFEVQPGDPAALAAAAIILLSVAAAACWGPARRAVRVNPVTALRIE